MPMDKTITTREHGVLVGVLRELRLTAGLRQSDVAERLDVHQSFVSKYESGERRLDLVELKQVAEALDINLSKLVRKFEETL